MKFLKQVLICSSCIVFTSCAINKDKRLERKFNRGSVVTRTPITTVNYNSINGLALVPVRVNGVFKNFIFDTGAAANLLRKKSKNSETLSVGGASKREVPMGYQNVKSIEIGEFDFKNTFALTNDLNGLNDSVQGIIGQTIIKRANWLFNYSKKKLKISNRNLADKTFRSIEIIREEGAPYTMITIAGQHYKSILDLGSRSDLGIPEKSELGKYLLANFEFKEIETETWTIGGLTMDKEKIGILPELKIGDILFKNVKMTIRETSQLRIGMPFFKAYLIYIDNINGDYKIKPIDN